MTDEQTMAPLFRLPPEQFTAARDRLVTELRQAGKAVVAAQVAKLARPTPVVWAINQIAETDRAAIEGLLSASDTLRRAQLGRASGSVATLTRAYQAVVAGLVERGLAVLRELGRAATPAIRHRLTATLMAASADPAISKSLRAGQLRREVAAVGFDVFEGARPALRVVRGAAPSGSEGQKPGPLRAAPHRDEARLKAEARVRVETARADVARAELRVAELARAETEAARLAAEARDRAAAARHATTEARGELARARTRLRDAEMAAPDR